MAVQDLSDAQLRQRASQQLTGLERKYREATRRLKERSGGGNDDFAKFALRAEKLENMLKIVHAEASLLESDVCDAMNEPMEIVLLSER